MSSRSRISLDPLLPLLKDWIEWDPTMVCIFADLQDDFKRRYATRGDGFFTLDLPEVDKVYCKGLSSGSLDWSKLPQQCGRPKSGTPLTRLLLTQFRANGESLAPCADTVFFTRTLLNLWKKTPKVFTEKEMHNFYAGFFQTDMALHAPCAKWGERHLDTTKCRRSRALLVGKLSTHALGDRLGKSISFVADRIVTAIPKVDLWKLKGANGPGAVAEGTKFRDKYRHHTWGKKLNAYFPSWLMLNYVDGTPSRSLKKEPVHSRLVGVPKSCKGPRLITIEPQAYVFCQKAMLEFLRENFPAAVRNTYSVQSQDPSREACRLASITGEFATVDLSEASDRLSLWLIEALFCKHPSLLRHLNACRMHVVENPVTGKPYKMKKYAGMGNATTFPVQSMVYSILCIASVIASRNWALTKKSIQKASRLVRVYGDDLIVPSDCIPQLGLALQACTLKVNATKTHFEGHFRESCGLDAYHGFDVTPFYMGETIPPRKDAFKRTPQCFVSWVEISNNAYEKGLWNVSTWMRDALPKEQARLIPTTSDEHYGLRFHSFLSASAPIGVRSRINVELQREEHRVLTLDAKVEVVERDSALNLLQFFTEYVGSRIDPTKGIDLSSSSFWKAGWSRSAGFMLKTSWV